MFSVIGINMELDLKTVDTWILKQLAEELCKFLEW